MLWHRRQSQLFYWLRLHGEYGYRHLRALWWAERGLLPGQLLHGDWDGVRVCGCRGREHLPDLWWRRATLLREQHMRSCNHGLCDHGRSWRRDGDL